jgi:hypothetical protein
MPTVTMQAPNAAYTTVATRTGNSYTSDSSGLVAAVQAEDVVDLLTAGYTLVLPGFAAFNIPLLSGRNTDGSSLAAAASAGKFGMTLTLGTDSRLVTQAANSSSVTDSVIWEVALPTTYPSGHNPTITVNMNHIIGAGTLSVHTVAVHAYPVNDDGSQDADIVTTAAQNTPASAADLVFATAASGEAIANKRLVVEVVVALTETAASNVTAVINSVRLS